MKRFVLYIGALLWVACVPILAQEGNLGKGVKAYQNKQYPEAISLLRAEIGKTPDSKQAQYYLGMALWSAGNPDSALIHLQKAWKLDSKNADYTNSLGTLYIEKDMTAEATQVFRTGLGRSSSKSNRERYFYGLGKAQMAADSLDSAIVYLMQARELDPKDTKVYVALGDAYSEQKVGSIAIDNYKQAVGLDSTLIEVHYNLAKLYYKERQYNEALAEYRAVIQLDPTYRDAHFQVANLYYLGKRYAEAIQFGEEVIRTDSSNVELTRILSNSYFDTRDYEKAAATFERLARIDSLNTQECLEWGRSYEALKQSSQAIMALEKAVAMDSTLDLHSDIGTMLYLEQRYPEAIAHFDKKIQSDPQASSAYFNRGISYIGLKDYKEAANSFRKGVELKPDYVQGHLWLAQSYATLDAMDQAKAEYQIVARMDSTNFEARRYIGFYYLLKKDYPSAISILDKALDLDPSNVQARLLLAQAYYLSKQWDPALAEYRRVLKYDPNNAEADKRVKMLE